MHQLCSEGKWHTHNNCWCELNAIQQQINEMIGRMLDQAILYGEIDSWQWKP